MPSSPLHRHRPRLPREPNIPVKASHELTRAILDILPFKAEAELKLAGFSGHRKQLLDHLRKPGAVHDDDTSWFGIETIAYRYFALQTLKQTVTDREARYRAISNAAQRAKHTIEKANRWVDHGGNELKAWLEGTKEFGEATEQYGDLLYTGVEFRGKFDKALENLSELEVAAKQLADVFHKGPGRPTGTSDLPWNYVCALEEVYQKSTGLKPGACDGPFARFVHEFLRAIGQGAKSRQYVIDVIKDARAQARKRAINSTSSPFAQ